VFGQYELYLGHAIANIGTIYHTERVVPDEAPIYEMAPYAIHKDAVRFANEQLFNTPLWLNNEEVMNKLPVSFGVELNNLQSGAINVILTRDRMSRLLWAEESATGRTGSATKKTYTVTELLDDLNKGIFRELYEGKNVDAYRRNLQNIYVGRLIEQAYAPSDQNFILPPTTYHIAQTDLLALLKDALRQQQKLFKKAMANPALDKMTRLHLQDLDTRISGKFAEEQHKGE
jgi:hypothetical protein